MRKLNRSEQKPTLIAQKKDMFNLSNDEYYNPKLSELPFRKDTVVSCVPTFGCVIEWQQPLDQCRHEPVHKAPLVFSLPTCSPAVQRLRPAWLTWREHLLSILSPPPGSTPCGSPPTTRAICCATSTGQSSRASPRQMSPLG